MVPFGRGAVGGFLALWRSLGLLQEPVCPVPFYLSLVLIATDTLLTSARIQLNWEQISVEMGYVLQVSVRPLSFPLFSSFANWLVC